MKIGSHVGMSGKEMLLGSAKEAVSYGANTFMFYTGAPQNTRRKAISELNILSQVDNFRLRILGRVELEEIVGIRLFGFIFCYYHLCHAWRTLLLSLNANGMQCFFV